MGVGEISAVGLGSAVENRTVSGNNGCADAAGAQVIRPLDDFAAKGKPDFSGIPGAFLAQQRYNGKLYSMVLDGDHIMLVLRKDIVENPKARAAFKSKTGKDLGCPETMADWEEQAKFSKLFLE